MPSIDPRQLNDLASLAARGGLGRGVATTDCVAEEPDQLMFIKGDELVLLQELPDCILASCEGVVGWVKKGEVDFQSVASSSSPSTQTLDLPDRDDVPRTILVAPSPPSATAALPAVAANFLEAPCSERDTRRISGPFELDSPRHSPGIEQAEFTFKQQSEPVIDKRDSVASNASSEAFGGIGGLMMGEPSAAGLNVNSPEELNVPAHSAGSDSSPARETDRFSEPPEWDIYDDYARESMYNPKRLTRASQNVSRIPYDRDSILSIDERGAIHAARVALEGTRPPLSEVLPDNAPDAKTPRTDALPALQTAISGRSIATELRLRIQKEMDESSLPNSLVASLNNGNGHDDNQAPPARPPRREYRQPSPIDAEDVKSDAEHLGSEESASTINLTTPNEPENTGPTLMASPMPFDDVPKVAEPLEVPSPIESPALNNGLLSSDVTLPQVPGWSPSLAAPQNPWTPTSPASPHSVFATRQAVDISSSTPGGRRPRGLTLVGRMESDLGAARGPVPITFLVGDSDSTTIGLGMPSGRKSPVTPRSRSPLSPPIPPMPDDISTIRSQPSRFPTPQRSVTSPMTDSAPSPQPDFHARPRSRSFSSTVAKAVGRKPLTIDTTPMPSPPRRNIFGLKSPRHTPPASPKVATSPVPTPQLNASTLSLSLPSSARSSSFSFASKGTKTPRKASRLPDPVSHKDFEDTVNAEGLDFELVQPRKVVPQSPKSLQSDDDTVTITSTLSSSKPLVETDEWGFVKEQSSIPEIYQSRAAPGDHRAMEQKWLTIMSAPIPSGGASKKVRRLATESGIPSSLRGKVWAWFMSPSMTARVAGLYGELCGHEKSSLYDAQIEQDVATLWCDHSLFHDAQGTGRSDLRSILRAYSNFAPSGYSTQMCHLAGTLLIHSVAEEAFWLLSGLINTALKEYYVKEGQGLKMDAAVFEAVIRGSERELSSAFKDAGVKASDYIDIWYRQLFVRCLPWPTTLRVIDAVVSEGPRFLFIAALTILTLCRERILALPRTKEAIVGYLHNLPQDSLLLPENFMRACDKVRFKEEDYRRLRKSAEKEVGPL